MRGLFGRTAEYHHCGAAWRTQVGDSPSNDIVFGKNAGVSTALLDSGRRHFEAGSTEDADFCVENLFQLSGLLWGSFEIPGGFPLCPRSVARAGLCLRSRPLGSQSELVAACHPTTT